MTELTLNLPQRNPRSYLIVAAIAWFALYEALLPGERVISDTAPEQVLKFDLRDYVYDAAVQWVAARLYQGQTTNFRTPGGGFAPVYAGPD